MRAASPKTAYVLLSILAFTSSFAFAWTEPVKIDDLILGTRMVAVGETLHVIAPEIGFKSYYLYSRDNGLTWSEPIVPVDTSRNMQEPFLAYSKGFLHLIWYEHGLYPVLYHSRSSDGGRSWSEPDIVFNNGHFRSIFYPLLATNGDSLFLVCVVIDDDYLHFRGFNFFRSFDGGQTWQDSTIVDHGSDLGIFQGPTLLYSNGILQLVYTLLTGNDSLAIEVYLKRSVDLGRHWSARQFLSPVDPYPHYIDSQIPSAAVDSAGHTLVAWMDYENGSMCGITGDIFYRISLDNGQNWQPYGSITNTQSGESSFCLILGNRYIVAWNDDWLLGCGWPKEAFSTSSDSGNSWEPREFTSGPVVSSEEGPSLAYTISGIDTVLHCVFARTSGGDSVIGLYYMRNQEFEGIGNHDNSHPPSADFWIKAYPNSFNTSTIISYNNPKGGDVELDIYDLLGQLIWRETINGKKGQIIWDAKDLEGNGISSGTYFVRAASGGNSKTIKLIYLK